LLVHGMGFSPDHRTVAVVAIGSNAVNFIDTATNSVKHVTYVGRSPHEAFFTMDGTEVWVVVRGENYVSVLDGTTYEEKTRITVPNGPGMTIFSPDGKYGYVCSSFTSCTVAMRTERFATRAQVREAKIAVRASVIVGDVPAATNDLRVSGEQLIRSLRGPQRTTQHHSDALRHARALRSRQQLC
jgi:DNA-binding beta-propeller fold protein YncE